MLPCKDCGKMVAIEALACPACGAPPPRIRDGEIISRRQFKGMTKTEKKAFLAAKGKVRPSALVYFLVTLVLLPAPILLVIAIVNSPPSAEDMADHALAACKVEIQDKLKDPDSAEFLDDPSNMAALPSTDGKYHILLRVRAANSFGAKVVSTMACTAEKSGSDWIATASESPL